MRHVKRNGFVLVLELSFVDVFSKPYSEYHYANTGLRLAANEY
jgi:hypothetical protein